MDARLAWARRYVKPPHGCEVRRLAAALTLAVGVPRLPIFAQTPTFDPLRFVAPWVYGVMLTALGLALLVTSYRGRLSVPGRLTAALGFAAWVMLAAATSSATSWLVNVAVASTLLAEVWTLKRCADE